MPPDRSRRVFMWVKAGASRMPTDPGCSCTNRNELAGLGGSVQFGVRQFRYRLVTRTVSTRLPAVGAGFEQPMLLALFPQVLARNAEQFRRALDVAARVFQGVANVFALGRSER